MDFSRPNRLKQNNPRSQWKRSTFFSNLILVRICIFSRSDFSGTSLCLDLAASSSCNKHQGLHLQCSYRMVSWDSYRCERFHCFTWNLRIHVFRGWCGGHHWFLRLITICVSYLSIRKRINNRTPAIHKAESGISAQQNTKLSKTLFIVIGAYVVLWVPSVIWYNISVWYPSLFPYFVTHIFTMLHITNSLVNPIIYSLRIPVFKKTIQQVRNKLKVVKRSKSYTFS